MARRLRRARHSLRESWPATDISLKARCAQLYTIAIHGTLSLSLLLSALYRRRVKVLIFLVCSSLDSLTFFFIFIFLLLVRYSHFYYRHIKVCESLNSSPLSEILAAVKRQDFLSYSFYCVEETTTTNLTIAEDA